ncbi:hypothetical protein [Pseudonocardia sp. ICBG601]|uniref:hypothetical protein n=1 Tax=Pseudonocardia sp. ICBG601 TaxID=2846759 RepID=UPI001CF6F801|nr:hypothetical protein [Pseudonocardia sp. ICBG601]
MNTPRNDPAAQNDRLPWPTWMSGPDRTAAEAAATADTVVFNRAALHDALTHDHRARPRATAQQSANTAPAPATSSAAASSTARPDTGPWLTLVILGLVIVAAMLVITVTWT